MVFIVSNHLIKILREDNERDKDKIVVTGMAIKRCMFFLSFIVNVFEFKIEGDAFIKFEYDKAILKMALLNVAVNNK